MKNCKCPYCGKPLSYFQALLIRKKGEYFCNKCKKDSNIHIKKTIFIPFVFVLIFSLLVLFVFLFMTNRENLWFLLLMIVPFFIFYLITPTFVRLKPKKKHMDALYDTQMVEAQQNDPDPTMAKTSKVVPAFVDDIVLEDEEYKPNINADVFNAIKEERKIISDAGGYTKAFDKFENISSRASSDTMMVKDIKDIGKQEDVKENSDSSYDLTNFE
ncbi:MAG: hypothetical protein IJH32_01830 [Ruminococcus sp.]|nr:hypothetical protein [Ruminococcus sp.]